MEEKKTLKVRAKEGWTKVKKEAADTGKLFWRGCKAVVPIIGGYTTMALFFMLLAKGSKNTSTDTGSDEIYDDEELKELVESEELSEEEA